MEKISRTEKRGVKNFNNFFIGKFLKTISGVKYPTKRFLVPKLLKKKKNFTKKIWKQTEVSRKKFQASSSSDEEKLQNWKSS